ncbi:hypothetical protein LCGC14_1623670 [marine sediment metagenome]|uniref:Methyltransferase small domain-containing protein n=1 Tax=marine sediment metagenome TaxID=412755 RepID=A0A0F9I4P6_9ZZZZ
MIDARLLLALDGDGVELPSEGIIAVFQPPLDADLPGLDKDRVQIIQAFKPDYDAWAARGYDVVRNVKDRYAACIVCLPRAKNEARALIADACEVCDGIVVIDGQKTDGVDSILREMRTRVTVCGPSLTDGGFWTAPGVFSADGVDLASALLVDALPENLGSEVADLGAGWGFLSAHALTRESIKKIYLIEAGHMALECARRNVTDERAEFIWEDATIWEPPHRMDTVIMNPPFHIGRAAEPQIGQAFVAAAARILSPQGKLWMVANRHLPYEAELKTRFVHVEEIGGDARFKLFHAARPLRKRR